MMKKLTAMLLVIALLLGMTTAFAWSCPACGNEMSGKFCAECGTKKPANICPNCGTDYGEQAPKFCSECGTKMAGATPAPTAQPTAVPAVQPTAEPAGVTWTDVEIHDNGTVTLSWVGGVPPYKVRYLEKKSNDFEADRNAPDSFGMWVAEKEYTETTYTYQRLHPGTAYWLSVVDSQGEGRYYVYTPSEVSALQGYSMSLEITPCSKTGEDTTELDALPAELLGLGGETSYGADIVVNYSNTGAEKTMFYQLAFTLPNGAVRVDKTGEATLKVGTNRQMGWEFFNMDWYLETTREAFDGIPSGDIKVEFFLDGKLAGAATLPVRSQQQGLTIPGAKEQGFAITGVQDQGDGTYLLTWTDNGKGPYKVNYVDKWSNDIEADRDNPMTSAYWLDEEDLADTSLVMKYLVPGSNYWIVVTDSEGEQAVTTHQTTAPQDAGMNMSATVTPRQKLGEDNFKDLGMFSAAVLNAEDAEGYGLYLDLDYDELPEATDMPTQMVITAPNGVRFCEYATEFTYYPKGTYWACYNLDWYFGKMKQWYGEVPQGNYFGELYINGDYAVSYSFTVGE